MLNKTWNVYSSGWFKVNIKAVASSVELPYEQGVKKEIELAQMLFTSGKQF